MPSWNIHTAHVQHLLAQGSPEEFGIKDANSFLFGNFVPDIYVGYMVEHPSGIMPYTITHLADPHAVPIPRAQEYWDTYVEPALEPARELPVRPVGITVDEAVSILMAGGVYTATAPLKEHEALCERLRAQDYEPTDVVLGAWAHLCCDACYNTATHAWLSKYNIEVGEETRINKQDDYRLYGCTLPITLTCEVTPELIAQAAEFPQYSISEHDVRVSVEAARAIVKENQENHIEGTPEYALFKKEFFAEIYAHVNDVLETQLHAFAQRRAG